MEEVSTSGRETSVDLISWIFYKKLSARERVRRDWFESKGRQLNPVCLFRSGPTTANFHTDYISIDHYKLLLSTFFFPVRSFEMENWRKKFSFSDKPSAHSPSLLNPEKEFLVCKINCFPTRGGIFTDFHDGERERSSQHVAWSRGVEINTSYE